MTAVLLLIALIGGWQAYADLSGIDSFVLPAPSAVASSLYHDAGLLWDNLAVSASEIGLGLAAALAVGLLLTMAIHFSDTLRRAVYPLLVASQTFPIPLFAPLLVTWFGFNVLPKIVIVAIVCFFPIVVSTLDALRRVDPGQRKLMRTFGASRWQTFRMVEAPSALPGLLTGARLSVAFATIAAILAEGAGSESGIGHLYTQSLPQFETARAYAAVLLLAAFAAALFGLLLLAERLLLPWSDQPTRGSFQ